METTENARVEVLDENNEVNGDQRGGPGASSDPPEDQSRTSRKRKMKTNKKDGVKKGKKSSRNTEQTRRGEKSRDTEPPRNIPPPQDIEPPLGAVIPREVVASGDIETPRDVEPQQDTESVPDVEPQRDAESMPDVEPPRDVVETAPEVEPSGDAVDTTSEVEPSGEAVEDTPNVEPLGEVVETSPDVEPSGEVVETKPDAETSQEIVEPLPDVEALSVAPREVVEALPDVVTPCEAIDALPKNETPGDADDEPMPEVEPKEEDELMFVVEPPQDFEVLPDVQPSQDVEPPRNVEPAREAEPPRNSEEPATESETTSNEQETTPPAENEEESGTSSTQNETTTQNDNEFIVDDDDDSDWIDYDEAVFGFTDNNEWQYDYFFSDKKFSDFEVKPEQEEDELMDTEGVSVGTEEVPVTSDDATETVSKEHAAEGANVVPVNMQEAIAYAEAIVLATEDSPITKWRHMVANGGTSVETLANAVDAALNGDLGAPGQNADAQRTPEEERVHKELRRKFLIDITTETVKIILKEIEAIAQCFENQRAILERELNESLAQPVVFDYERAQELAIQKGKYEIIRRQGAVRNLTEKFRDLLSVLQDPSTLTPLSHFF